MLSKVSIYQIHQILLTTKQRAKGKTAKGNLLIINFLLQKNNTQKDKTVTRNRVLYN
jgi:hypothetical protein